MWRTLQPELERLASELLIAADIADRLTKLWGAPVTRNAVIGRANRTGVELCSRRDASVEAARRRSIAVQQTPFYPCGHPRTDGNSRHFLRPNGTVNKHCLICQNKRRRRDKEEAV